MTLTKKEIFEALENTGFGTPKSGSWLFDRWEDVATVACAYAESFGVLSVFVSEDESVQWAADMLAADNTVDQACKKATELVNAQDTNERGNR